MTKKSVAVQCYWLGDPRISLKNLEGIREEKRKQDVKRLSMRRWRECRGRRYELGRKRIRGLKARAGRECCISRGGPRLSSGDIQAGGVRRGGHRLVGVGSQEEAGMQQGRQLQE